MEEALNKFHSGLSKKGTIKKYTKVIERIGRLREKNTQGPGRYFENDPYTHVWVLVEELEALKK